MVWRIAFRADASLDIGTGHVMRCLTLADALRKEGAVCRFLCSPLEGNLIDYVRQRGYAVDELPLPVDPENQCEEKDLPVHQAWLGKGWQLDAQQVQQALEGQKQDWLVVDHYALDVRWETATAAVREHLLVIDDLADRLHVCDGLLDQNLGSLEAAYAEKVPEACQLFVGAQYAMLRPEFANLRRASLERRASGGLSRLLISMGGVDKGNVTAQVLYALQAVQGLQDDLSIDVVMGQHAPWLEDVKRISQSMPWETRVHVNTSDMAQHMVNSDLAIGAAGSTSWERCVLALPTVMAVLADNQRNAAHSLQQTGAVLAVEMGANFEESVRSCVELLARDSTLRKNMSKKSAEVTSGDGVEILVKWMRGLNMSELGVLREISDDELELMLAWRNAPTVRNNMYTRQVIRLEDHLKWWAGIKKRPDQKYFMYEFKGVPTGIVAFNDLDAGNENSAWAFYASPDAPKGTGSRMEFLALEHAFDCLNLSRLYCEVLDFNTSVVALHKKFGFVEEGIKRKHHKMDDGFHDVVCLGILATEWKTKKEAMRERLMEKTGD